MTVSFISSVILAYTNVGVYSTTTGRLSSLQLSSVDDISVGPDAVNPGPLEYTWHCECPFTTNENGSPDGSDIIVECGTCTAPIAAPGNIPSSCYYQCTHDIFDYDKELDGVCVIGGGIHCTSTNGAESTETDEGPE